MSKEILNRVLQEIDQRGWTKKDFAGNLNEIMHDKNSRVSPQKLYQWEKREKIPEKYHKSIADLFGWSIELLISGDDGKDATYSLRELEMVQKLRQLTPGQRDALSTFIDEILKGDEVSSLPNIQVKGSRKSKTRKKRTVSRQ